MSNTVTSTIILITMFNCLGILQNIFSGIVCVCVYIYTYIKLNLASSYCEELAFYTK